MPAKTVSKARFGGRKPAWCAFSSRLLPSSYLRLCNSLSSWRCQVTRVDEQSNAGAGGASDQTADQSDGQPSDTGGGTLDESFSYPDTWIGHEEKGQKEQYERRGDSE